MTTVTNHIESLDRYVWTVPCSFEGQNQAAMIGDLLSAYSMMRSEAMNLGVNVDCDDWARVSPSDESVRLYFDRTKIDRQERP